MTMPPLNIPQKNVCTDLPVVNSVHNIALFNIISHTKLITSIILFPFVACRPMFHKHYNIQVTV